MVSSFTSGWRCLVVGPRGRRWRSSWIRAAKTAFLATVLHHIIRLIILPEESQGARIEEGKWLFTSGEVYCRANLESRVSDWKIQNIGTMYWQYTFLVVWTECLMSDRLRAQWTDYKVQSKINIQLLIQYMKIIPRALGSWTGTMFCQL